MSKLGEVLQHNPTADRRIKGDRVDIELVECAALDNRETANFSQHRQ
jgi:hypothetical protein